MAERLTIPIKMLDDHAASPAYAHAGDAGVDLEAACDLTLRPFERAVVPLGFAIAIPDGFAGLVLPRSGLATNHGITMPNAPGLIDSGYRGELKVAVMNVDPEKAYTIRRGDRIAQLVIVRVPAVTFDRVDDLDESERGMRGFGSSGISDMRKDL